MSLKRSVAWVGIAQMMSLVLQFALSVILARLLTPYQMGIFGIAAATTGFLSIVQAIGLQALIVREEQLTPELTSTAFTINVALSAFISALIVAVSFFGGTFLHDGGVRDVLLLMAIGPLFGIFTFLPSAKLERAGQFKLLTVPTTLGSLAGTCAIIVLAFRGFSYMSMPIGGLFGAAIGAVLLNIVGREHISFRMGVTSWRRVATFGLQMLTVSGVSILSERLSEIMLGRLRGLSSLGLFNRANSLNLLLWTNIYYVISKVVFVEFAQLSRERASLRERYLLTVDVMTAILWPAFAGFAVLSGPVIFIIYGPRWLPAAPVLAILAFASIILVSLSMSFELFAATGNLGTQSRIEFIRATVSTVLFVAGATYSLTAAAAARIADALFGFILYRKHLDRMTNTTLRDLAPIYLGNAGLSAVAVTPPVTLMTHYNMQPDVPFVLVLASVLVGAAFWVAGLVALRHPLVHEARKMYAKLSTMRRFRSAALLAAGARKS